MSAMLDPRQRKTVTEMTARLRQALGDRLRAVVLHGPAARGEHVDEGELHLLVVVTDLELTTLGALAGPMAYARKRGLPVPRIFSPALLASSGDVFPIELLELGHHREVLTGTDPIGEVAIDLEHLRVQCEREITEKLMRLREAYAESGGRPRHLRRLMIASFPELGHVLAGALRVLGQPVPARSLEVARAFCRAARIDEQAFVEVDAVRHGEAAAPVAEVFARYYAALGAAAEFIDGLEVATATGSPRKGAVS